MNPVNPNEPPMRVRDMVGVVFVFFLFFGLAVFV